MEKSQSMFCTTAHAALYAKYRFEPPQSIIKCILNYLGEQVTPPFAQALDVGCGSGQSTRQLAEHFERVTGLDNSEAQIDEAIMGNRIKNISYKVGAEKNLPFDRDRVQLITASQCHHWLDLPAFYEEGKRVLVSKGVFCIYFYQRSSLIHEANTSSDFEKLIQTFHYAMASYGDERRMQIQSGFDEDFYFPFEDVIKEHFTGDKLWTVTEVCGNIQSSSAYQAFLKADSEKAKKSLDDLQEKILVSIGSQGKNPDDVKVTVRHLYTLIMGRKL